MRSLGADALARESQPVVNDGELQAHGLLGVEPEEAPVELRQVGQVGVDAGAQVRIRPGEALAHRQVLEQAVHDGEDVGDGVVALEVDDRARHLGRDEGIAVPIAANPGAEGEWSAVGRQVRSEEPEGGSEVVEHLREGSAREVVEVVEGIARLVDHLRLLQAELIGAPQQVDELGDARPAALVVDEGVEEQVGDPALLGEHRTPGGLGGMGGEDRAHRHLPSECRCLLGRHSLVQGAARRAREQASLRAALGAHVAGALDLLRDVGKVEVDGERPGDHGRLVQVKSVDDPAGLGGVVPDRGADALHGVEERIAPVLGERVAEEGTQGADVLAQGCIGCLVCRGHDRTVPSACCAGVS